MKCTPSPTADIKTEAMPGAGGEVRWGWVRDEVGQCRSRKEQIQRMSNVAGGRRTKSHAKPPSFVSTVVRLMARCATEPSARSPARNDDPILDPSPRRWMKTLHCSLTMADRVLLKKKRKKNAKKHNLNMTRGEPKRCSFKMSPK